VSTASIKPFARYGTEKMLYDVRMGPQAVYHKEMIYIVYQANPEWSKNSSKPLRGDPYIITYNLESRTWSEPIRVGKVPRRDHHFAPILWFDKEEHIHILYGCHTRSGGGTHLVSKEPLEIQEWKQIDRPIWKSISYPRILHLSDGRLLLYYRAFGHQGYWTYQMSSDGGYSWTKPRPLIDFDRDPQEYLDIWLGTYQSVCLAADGRSVHVAFVRLDDRKALRRHLYYARLDPDSGQLYTIEGDRLELPVNREQADEACKVWDTGMRHTNMPAILNDSDGQPCFLMPVSDSEKPWPCTYYFIRRYRGEWILTPVTKANSKWDGCMLRRSEDGELLAYLVTGDQERIHAQNLEYGGGERLEEWKAIDEGSSWEKKRTIISEPGMLYNNPKPVELSTGGVLDGFVVFYGWQGPGNNDNRGMAYLWHEGEWL